MPPSSTCRSVSSRIVRPLLPGRRRPDRLARRDVGRPHDLDLPVLHLDRERTGVRETVLVEGDVTGRGLEGPLVENLADLLAIDGTGALDRLHHDEVRIEAVQGPDV